MFDKIKDKLFPKSNVIDKGNFTPAPEYDHVLIGVGDGVYGGGGSYGAGQWKDSNINSNATKLHINSQYCYFRLEQGSDEFVKQSVYIGPFAELHKVSLADFVIVKSGPEPWKCIKNRKMETYDDVSYNSIQDFLDFNQLIV